MQRDLAVLATQHVDVACVVTAITAQSNAAVRDVHAVPTPLLESQFWAALEAPVHAIKVGMLPSAEAVQCVAGLLRNAPEMPCVVDPVLVSTSGRQLLPQEALECLKSSLCPTASLVTPNLREAATMLGVPAAIGLSQQQEQARALATALGSRVLLKGGHGEDARCTDVLASDDGAIEEIQHLRVPGQMRGSGCALSSLIAAHLAKGAELGSACRAAQAWVAAAIAAGN